MSVRSIQKSQLAVFLAVASIALFGARCSGLDFWAYLELEAAGVNKYLGEFEPASTTDVGDGWTKHTFDTEGGEGPICISGTEFSAFTREGDPEKLLIFEQGGGACWQDFYFCNAFSEDQEPPTDRVGIWDFDNPDNPFADYSIVYMPYCDGSVFSGDNDVEDPNYPLGPVRYHRGLRNQSAAMDVGHSLFPDAKEITLSGSSAGGVGVDGFAPFLVRFLWRNQTNLSVLNDAGPITVNLAATEAIAARAEDWQFGQFYPESCEDCDALGKATAVIAWRLKRDRTIREGWYETDGDGTNRFFLGVPTQEEYRELIIEQTDELRALHPFRFKRFIVSKDASHTAVQSPLFYTQEVNGVPLNEWSRALIEPSWGWRDLVAPFEPLD